MSFPTTGIIDDFNRNDEGPPIPGWLNNITTLGRAGLKVVGNQCVPDGVISEGYWAQPVDASCENYITITSIGAVATFELFLRIVEPNTIDFAATSVAFVNDSNAVQLWDYPGSGDPILSGTLTIDPLVIGDSIGASVRGRNLSAWIKSAGVWTLVCEGGAAPPVGGFLGVAMYESGGPVNAFDDFGGGSTPSETQFTGGMMMISD